MSDTNSSEDSSEADGNNWKRPRSWGSNQSNYNEEDHDFEQDVKDEEEEEFDAEQNKALFEWALREEDK